MTGRAKSPVYLYIKDGKVELRDASHLLGKSPLETAKLIQEELKDPKIQVAAIGVAGENRAVQATVDHSSTSAPMGVGAVFGDKNLKAVAVRGTGEVRVASALELFGVTTPLFQAIFDNPPAATFFSTPPIRNCSEGSTQAPPA